MRIRSSKPSEKFQFEELLERLKRVERKVDALAERVREPHPPERVKVIEQKNEPLDVMALLSIPDHLRKSAMVLIKMGEAMASDVAKETGRSRAIESAYLNQLIRMGYLKGGRKGRRVYFQIQEQPRRR